MDQEKLDKAIAEAQEKAKESGLEFGDRRYLPVKDRLEIFRKFFGLEYGINTSVEFEMMGDEVMVISHAIVTDHTGRTVSSGHGTIFYGRDEVATNSPVEAAETFAIGRALASLGLYGNEYASANEMERVMPRRENKEANKPPKMVDEFAKDLTDKYHGMSEKEADFRKAVDEAFPPKVGKNEHFIPPDNSPESMQLIYEEIDKIENEKELHHYYTLLEESMQWMSPEDVQEIKDTFKSRRNQIRKG